MKVKCLIIDDEKPARELIKSYAEKIPDLEVVACLKNPLEALKIIQQDDIELLMLDIQMPEITGVDLIKCLDVKKPAIILTTAYQEYALLGYELDVIDYLLKPISFERFLKGINKGLQQVYSKIQSKNISEKNHIKDDAEYIVLKADHKTYKVNYIDIYFIEGLKEYVTFHTIDKKIIVYETMKNLELILPEIFLRVHKSFIVNKNWVKALSGNQLELPHTKIPIGISYKEIVKTCVF